MEEIIINEQYNQRYRFIIYEKDGLIWLKTL